VYTVAEMGDYSFLVGFDPVRGVNVAPELEAKYYVPLFWMALFDPDDVRDATVEGQAFAKPPNATEKFEDTTYAYCDAARALERLNKSIPRLGSATNEVLATKFARFAKKYAKHSVLLRLSSLAESSPIEYVKRFRESLAAIADPSTPPDRLREIAGLEPAWETQPYAENLLVGWGTKLTVQELGVTKQRRAVSKADRAERERKDQWQAAIAQVPVESRKQYAASSAFAVGDVVDHVKFGCGVVARIVEKTKIEVQFEDGLHVLVHKPIT
jgi:hypothetical protein